MPTEAWMAEEPGMGEGRTRVQPNRIWVHLAFQAESMQKLWIEEELGELMGQKGCPKEVLSTSWEVADLQRPC